MAGRLGLARLEALLEALERDIDLSDATLTGMTLEGHKVTVETKTDNYTVLATDSGKTFLMGTDAKTFTLPATVAGLTFTFINSGADGNNIVTISPAAADAIHGTTGNAGAVVLGGVDDKDLINTKSTATTGDMVTLIGDGVAGWYVTTSSGIWASES